MKNKILICTTALLMTSGLITLQSCKKTEETPSQNQTSSSLLSGSVKGRPFSTGVINDFTLASDGKNVIMLAANNNTGMVYAIDLEDADASKAAENKVNGSYADFGTLLAATLGASPSQLGIMNMEVNPISKSIYFLVYNTSSQLTSVVKITKGGTDMKVMSFDNVTYSSIQFSNMAERVNDMTWGNNTLYMSFNHSTTLVGKVGSFTAPFVHNAQMKNRATTVFKTNWGGGYFTDAPLESMCFGTIKGVNRLMGVTVCAPGYSFQTDAIEAGTGLLEVKEYFNLNTGRADKVYCATANGKTYLIEHHETGRITRIGENYLDESQTAFNANSKSLLVNGGTTVASGLGEEDIKVIQTGDNSRLLSAPYGDNQIITMTNTGALSLMSL